MSGYGLKEDQTLSLVLENDLKEDGYNIKIINGSVSGDTSEDGLDRIEEYVFDSDIDLIVLGLGANDMLRGISPENTKKNLEEIIKSVQKKNISILLTGMQAPSSYGQDYQSSFNSIYPELAEEYEIFLYPFLLEGVALDPILNQSDGKHPNELGIALISKNIAEKIINILN